MRLLRKVVLYVLLLGFWIALSGHLDALFLGMGVVSAAVCTWFGGRLLASTVGDPSTHRRVHPFWLLIYVGWMFGRMIIGATQVARIVLDPRRAAQPGILRFRTDLQSPAARTMFANSITLVPGTLTLELERDRLTVHSFTPSAVEDITSARLQNRVAAVFREPDQPRPQVDWEFGASDALHDGPGSPATAPFSDEEVDR
ncbi:MAG: Na+/H+ antiporter subunit E [Nitriliruptoraceae bacterium]